MSQSTAAPVKNMVAVEAEANKAEHLQRLATLDVEILASLADLAKDKGISAKLKKHLHLLPLLKLKLATL